MVSGRFVKGIVHCVRTAIDLVKKIKPDCNKHLLVRQRYSINSHVADTYLQINMWRKH